MKINAFILLASFGMPIAAIAQNSNLPFSSGSTGADGPLVFGDIGLGGSEFGFAWDPSLQAIVRTGGVRNRGSFSIIRNTYRWNGEGWSQITSNGGLPDRGLSGPALAYDEARGELVLYGGYAAGNLQYNALVTSGTWVLSGSSWNSQPGSKPPARRDHAMVYDAEREVIVMFGGRDLSNNPMGDTWTWNGSTWTNTGANPAPSARYFHSMAYDSVRKNVVLFGGTADGGETWTWNGSIWTLEMPTTSPSARNSTAMAFDDTNDRVVLFGGSSGGNQTWTWDGGEWNQESPTTIPASRQGHGMAWDNTRQTVVMAGKRYTSSGGIDSPDSLETWSWDGSNWRQLAGLSFNFDLSSDDDAVWNFTKIDIDNDVTVTFKNNAANTGVVWLASEDVSIRGIVDLSGTPTSAVGNLGKSGGPATGGPGGFDGGLGGRSTTDFPTAGGGPGMGLAGAGVSTEGGHATHSGTYGTAFGIPLIGGSGGGGGSAASGGADGGKGGSGGGALLIASSRDISVSGTILTRSGARATTGSAGDGGHGSGGTVRLIGDRILATGTIDATCATPSAARDGRIRLEGYIREFVPARTKGSLSASVPVGGDLLAQAAGRLRITDVAGMAVAIQPGGDPMNPDVVFGETGDVTITVQALNIPDGTPVTLTIEHDIDGTIDVPAVNLINSQAVFTRTISAGNEYIQAFANYQVGGN